MTVTPATLEPSVRVRRRQRPLYAPYAANLISYIGDMMMFLAVPWFVLQTTGSVGLTGITAFFTTGSIAVAALLGSAVVDHLGFKRASVVSDLATASLLVNPALRNIDPRHQGAQR